MAKPAVKLRQTSHFTNGQGAAKSARDAAKAARDARRASLEGETWAGLTPAQKDDVLKALAIEAGIIEE